jgi:tetratricopeptide (TPR) repeat protein
MDDQGFLQASQLRDEGKFREAIEKFLSIAEITEDPIDKAGVVLNVATTFKALGDYDEARRQLRVARDLFLAAGRSPEAAQKDKRVLQLGVSLAFEEADICSFEGKIEEALAKFDRALDEVRNYRLEEPELRELYQMIQMRRAFILADLGRCKEALPILEEAESFDGPKGETLFYLGHCYLADRDYRNAAQRLTRSLEIGLARRLDYRAHCELGIAYYRLAAYAKAILEFEKSVETGDKEYIEEAQIWKWLENSSRALGLDDQAERYSKRVVQS